MMGLRKFAGIYATLALAFASHAAQAEPEPCKFDRALLSFPGTGSEQARCLLRPIGKWARLGETLKRLPSPLAELVGKPVKLDKSALAKYLARRGIGEAEVGGNLSGGLSRAKDNASDAPLARYFVIHDTSSPYLGSTGFQGNIDQDSWSGNNLKIWDKGPDSAAHVFINRVGEALTAVDFAKPWRATKLESIELKLLGKGLFLHVELVQPRRADPDGPKGNDAVAPSPGFSNPQLRRLALVYVAASLRGGTWMIPAFHGAVDAGFPDAHDDPQKFSLDAWCGTLRDLLNVLRAEEKT